MVAPSTVAERLDGLDTPQKLSNWWPLNAPTGTQRWASAYDQQCHFVFYELGGLLIEVSKCDDYGRALTNASWAVSTHRSRSILLPVFKLKHPTQELELILRCNFYNWRVSVISDTRVADNFHGLFDRNKEVAAVSCEGFDDNWVFGSYAYNQQQFTIELSSDYKLFTFLWLLLKGQTD